MMEINTNINVETIVNNLFDYSGNEIVRVSRGLERCPITHVKRLSRDNSLSACLTTWRGSLEECVVHLFAYSVTLENYLGFCSEKTMKK